jgi:hypothetical protein
MRIETVEDFKRALLRLDDIFDIPIDDPRRDERAALIDAIEEYEDEHCSIQPPTEEEARAFRREQELLVEDRGLPLPVEVPPVPLVLPPRKQHEFDFFDKSPDNLKAVEDRLMKVIEEACRNQRECFINKIKDSFEEIDKFARENQEEIFILNDYRGSKVNSAEYAESWIHKDTIRLIYDEYERGEDYSLYPFDIPIKYINNLDGWLEDLSKEKEERDKKREEEKTEASLGSGI